MIIIIIIVKKIQFIRLQFTRKTLYSRFNRIINYLKAFL